VELTGAAVHVWRVEVGRGAEPALLSADERARAASYARDADRDRFVAARGALRRILAGYTGRAAAAIRFAHDDRGKPLAVDGLELGVSHSGDLALVAIARRPIGVDVEAHREVDVERLAATFAASTRDELRALAGPQQRAAFFRCWTRHEARAKCVGLGLALAHDPAPAGWWIESLAIDAGYSAAIAARGEPGELIMRTLDAAAPS
jgi:4'-phosphopantetheinyl transferase